MKPCIDERGNILKGLFKKDDGSIVVIDPVALQRAQAQKSQVNKLVDEIELLKTQMHEIMKLLNKN